MKRGMLFIFLLMFCIYNPVTKGALLAYMRVGLLNEYCQNLYDQKAITAVIKQDRMFKIFNTFFRFRKTRLIDLENTESLEYRINLNFKKATIYKNIRDDYKYNLYLENIRLDITRLNTNKKFEEHLAELELSIKELCPQKS